MMHFNPSQLDELAETTEWLIECVDTLASTNTTLQEYATQHSIHRHALIAYEQLQGRGRQHKKWHAKAGETLMLSLGWTSKLSLTQLTQGISLVIGLSLVEAIANQPQTSLSALKLKWPNDLLLLEKKVGGILIDVAKSSFASQAGSTTLIIGIGLNWLSPPIHEVPDGIGLDKLLPTHQQSTRHALLKALIIRITQNLLRFETDGFQPFRHDWMKYHIWAENTPISWIKNAQTHNGTLHRLDERGIIWVTPLGHSSPVPLGEHAYTLRVRKEAS
jgi:BirA family transcriptional regulator, biotin operon repressor / biotin---[acetyl-CoA-carboxylase] ligase